MKKLTRSLPIQPHRDAWVEVNLAALEENIQTLRAFVPPSQKLMAIVKADAYGHGAVMTLPTLIASGVEMLGVASIDEGVQIREAGFDISVLVVGPSPSWAFSEALEHQIQLTVFESEAMRQLNALAEQRHTTAQVQLKVDTGMHRIGAKPDQMQHLYDTLADCPNVQVTGIFSHLACSDDETYTRQQHNTFQHVLKHMPDTLREQCEWIHLSNSTGLVYPFVRCEEESSLEMVSYNAVRLGIALWGYWDSPSPEMQAKLPIVYPVMSLRGRIVHLHEIPKNEGVSYTHSDRLIDHSVDSGSPAGQGDGLVKSSKKALSSLSQSSGQDVGLVHSLSYQSSGLVCGSSFSSQVNQNRRIATCPIGYADGVPRLLSNRMHATFKTSAGQWVCVPQVGNITMDQLMFDVTAIPDVQPGDTLTLFGITADHQANSDYRLNPAATVSVTTLSDWATMASTIEYELMCGLRVRLPRAYTRHTAYRLLDGRPPAGRT